MGKPGLDVARHESDLGRWEMARRVPQPRLRPWVEEYCGYWEQTPRPLKRRQLPSRKVAVIISFGDPIEIQELPMPGHVPESVVSFVAALHDGPAVLEHSGRQHGVEIELTPLGARRLLGVPMHELTNRVVEIDDLLGRAADTLSDRLASADGWQARFDILDEVLESGLEAGPGNSPHVARAWERLVGSGGAVTVAEITEELGWSRRHLNAQFRSQIGLSPKVVARVLRFERACELMTGLGGRPVADVAAACGYYDQAHLNREFRDLAGRTPSELIDAELPGGGGVLEG